MQLGIDTYWPLLLLGLIPYFWLVQRKTMVDLSPKHLQLSGAVRASVVVLVAFALMQPVVYRSGDWLSVVYLLDISQSVSPPAVQSAIDWIQKTNDAGGPDHSRFVAFGGNSGVFEDMQGLRNVQVSSKPGTGGAIDQSSTNIQEGLDRAIRSFAPHHLKRLVLLTDGNENTGAMSGVVTRLKQEGVHVYTVPMAARTNKDIWVEAIMAPAEITADELFPIEAHVYSQVDGIGEVEIRNGAKKLDSRKVTLKRGLNRVAFESRITGDSGPITIEAEIKSADDPFTENNTFKQAVVVQGQPKVLYVEGHTESSRYLREALTLEGFNVEIKPPFEIPANAADLDAYDIIILSDVARSGLVDRQMLSLATYVRDLGGGFILSGGENNYGTGGYSDTAIEEILPITFEAKKEKDEEIAMIVILDKSGSMGGQKMELAKEAGKAPLEFLKETDRFGLIAFDYNFYWPVRFQVAMDPAAIRTAISRIIAGGETNLFPALREAYLALAEVDTAIKHVIVLSDGRSLPEDFQTLTVSMADAKITVSTVAVGNGADREMMASIANWGKGRTYYIEDATKVPQIFTQETQIATGKTLREEVFRPIVKKKVEAFKGIDFDKVPSLLGYVATQSKETAEVLLESGGERNDPILARWQYGLGRTAAFTSDLKDRWAVDWLKWDGYGKFWSQLVRETMRRNENEEFDFRVANVISEAKITINAMQKDGQFRNKLKPEVRVVAPDESVTVVNVNQTGPGSYEANFPLKQKGTYVLRASDQEGAGSSRLLTYSYPDEYHFYPPNTDALRLISTETGGKFQPAAEDIFNANGETTALPTPLWPYLTTLALLLYITDVLLRRLRLFEN